jgi:hypothetical protein
MVLAVVVSVAACAGKVAPATIPLSERIAELKAQEAERLANETPEDRAIRARAEEIEREMATKKAREEAKRSGSPAMRKAIKEFEKAKKAITNSGLQGCDPSTVDVHPDVAPRRNASSTVKVQAFNQGQVPVDIYEPKHGLVVRNLCPGGSLTLFRARRLGIDPDYIQFRYVAKAILSDGRMLTAESQQYQLSKYDWSSGRGRQEYDWYIEVR